MYTSSIPDWTLASQKSMELGASGSRAIFSNEELEDPVLQILWSKESLSVREKSPGEKCQSFVGRYVRIHVHCKGTARFQIFKSIKFDILNLFPP
jgi:hypothetical protein